MRDAVVSIARLGAFVVIATGCICDCDVDSVVAARAGAGATDCGFVPLGGDAEVVLSCVELAIAEGRGVHAGWARRGRDSEVRTYVAGHDGSFSLFGFDGDPSGGSGACPTLTDFPCTDTPRRSVDALGMDIVTCSSASFGNQVCSR
jgi:hypothetical protein